MGDVVRSFKRRYCPESFNYGLENIWDDDANVKLSDIYAQLVSKQIDL